MLNFIGVDIDVIIGTLGSNLNKIYQPLLELDEADKTNILYLIVKV